MPLQRTWQEEAVDQTGKKRLNILLAPFFLQSDLVGIAQLQSPQAILPMTHLKWHVFKIFLDNASLAIRSGQFNKLANDYRLEREGLSNSRIHSDHLAMKGQMAAKIGHEMNNYLSGIHANVEMAIDLARNRGKRNSVVERLEKAQEMANS